ncbi:MAG: hydrolase 1, exosortase A system-associated [Burkholderiales bacterium]|nr:hydrolase 1, exosortase A system-associated [Burkholderiales bacterium]
MTATETAVVFPCAGEELLGIVSTPAAPAAPPTRGALIVVGGPQYRVGSHRMFVHLARHLAENGVAAMRFDARGMGDSSGPRQYFEDFDADIGAALDALFREVPSLRTVAIWGLCGGATAALLYVQGTRDARVGGLALVNPWVRTDITQAVTQVKHYYLQRLLQGTFWRKLLRGGVALTSLAELWRALRLTARATAAMRSTGRPQIREGDSDDDLGVRMAHAWAGFSALGGRTLLILSERDYTAKEFLETAHMHPVWQSNFAHPLARRVDLPEADHTFPQPEAHARVERATLDLLAEMT